MQSRHVFGTMILALAACVSGARAARADSVIYDSTNFIEGQQSFVQAITLTAPGVLTISLADVPWLDTVQDLTCFMTSTRGIVGSSMGVGTESMALAAGTYYAHWFGEADGRYGVGVDSLKITFRANRTVPVPLPASAVLLLAGLGLLFGWQRREEPHAATQGPGEAAT